MRLCYIKFNTCIIIVLQDEHNVSSLQAFSVYSGIVNALYLQVIKHHKLCSIFQSNLAFVFGIMCKMIVVKQYGKGHLYCMFVLLLC